MIYVFKLVNVFLLPLFLCNFLKSVFSILTQVQVLLQHKTKDEKTAEELTAQYIQDTNVLQEQLRRYKKQLQTTEQMIVAKDERDAKLQSQVRKEEESLAHMKELLSEKGLETKDDLLRELNKVKKLAQAAEEKAAVCLFGSLTLITDWRTVPKTGSFLCFVGGGAQG